MKRALVSVSDKNGVVEFCKELQELGYEIISTGGTRKKLSDDGVKVIGISEITNFPEILGGRVKTLHPNIHGGLLAVRDSVSHQEQMKENSIDYIDLVCVNLYPFEQTITNINASFDDAIENIDIGGPSMLRSAAKNFKYVTVVCDQKDYKKVIDEIKTHGNTTLETRMELSAKVFRHTAKYDSKISEYLTSEVGIEFPESLTQSYDLVNTLRYGENPHQKAAYYKNTQISFGLSNAKQVQGKELSYNNIQDSDAAIQIANEYKGQGVIVALKHMNACGIGVNSQPLKAWEMAYQSDPISIFGGIIATDFIVDALLAEQMNKIFLEVIIAPKFTKGAKEIFSKKKNLRLLELDISRKIESNYLVHSVMDGILVQERDNKEISEESLEVVTELKPTNEQIEDILFAWKSVKHIKSNAITICSGKSTVGIGPGQSNRVGAAKIALEQARNNGHVDNLVLASDAFFPFSDVVELASDYGVKCIVQPGGSIKDNLSIEACNKLGIVMVFTKTRAFKH